MVLPDYAETHVQGNLHILFGGFNPAWKAGALERTVVQSYATVLSKRYPDLKIHVVVPSWWEPLAVVDHINQVQADLCVVCSLTDPLGAFLEHTQNITVPVKYLGYTHTDMPWDFWAYACDKYFRKYNEHDLTLHAADFLYLNYNRKPRHHRTKLIHALRSHELMTCGVITDAGWCNTDLSESVQDYLDYGGTEVSDDIAVPNDIYSLGNLDIWQRCLINIVSETHAGPDVFLSEKVWKPILGMRPFVINGTPLIYQWLADRGFDCFTDIFSVKHMMANPELVPEIIAQDIKRLQHVNRAQLYTDLLPRLQHNRQQFFYYVKYHGQPDHIPLC